MNTVISVVTPTYNRHHTLERLWQSLCAQIGNIDFEWLLVDDGSVDETRKWFADLTKPNHVSLRYISQPNQGKHVAINNAVAHAKGGWVFIVDSDDAVTADAIAAISQDIVLLGKRNNLVGLCYRKNFFDGKLVGRRIRGQEPTCLKPNAAGALFQGDLAYVFKRKTLAANTFPVIEQEKFVPELLVWNRIADMGDIYYFPEKSIYLCEYMPDGYSNNFNRMLKQNPRGFGMFYLDQLKRLQPGLAWAKALVRYGQCKFFHWTKP